MPLFIDTYGSIATWLDGKDGRHYLPTGALKPSAVPLVAGKVQSENRWKLRSTSHAKVLETLNLFVGSSASEADRIEAGRKVHYKNVQPYPNSWDDLANFIKHEIVINSNRIRELEMAMIIAKSPVVMGTVNATILAIEKLMMAVRLSRGASLTTIGDKPDYDVAKLINDHNVTKFYLPWTQRTSVNAALGDSGAGFTRRVALLHNLMEFSVMMFASSEVRKALGVAHANESPGNGHDCGRCDSGT